MPIPKISYVLSDQGQFVTDGDPATTTQADMDSAFAQFKQQRDANNTPLAIFFHGGLVDEKTFMTDPMPTLLQQYRDVGKGFPYFFVWRTGIGETIMDWARDHLGGIMSNQKVSDAVQAAHEESSKPEYADALQSTQTFREFSALDTPRTTQTDSTELQAKLEAKYRKEPRVQKLQAIFTAKPVAQPRMLTLEKPQQKGGAMTDDEVVEAVNSGMAAPHTSGELMMALPLGIDIAAMLAEASVRVIWRNINHRNHPGVSTMSEEVARALGVAAFGQTMWQTMKDDSTKAFNPTGVGTAFIQGLKTLAASDPNKTTRVLLIAHSAGAIYVVDFLNAVEAMQVPSNVTFDVIYMAAAVRSDKFGDLLQSNAGKRISNFRSFSMQDPVEQWCGLSGIKIIDALFPASLLYVISGILEPEPDYDVPLAGMDRFIGVNTRFASIDQDQVIINYATHARPAVWSPTDSSAKPGYTSAGKDHGGFPVATLDSTNTLIQKWQ